MIHTAVRKSSLLGVLLAAILSAGCSTSMDMTKEEIQDPSTYEGIVVGSFLIEGSNDILGRTGWKLLANRTGSGYFSSDYSIEADQEEGVEVFVAKLHVGEYRFYEMKQTGFSDASYQLNLRFLVKPGEVTYIGRVVLCPPPAYMIRDAKEEDLDAAMKKLGITFTDVTDGLMEMHFF